MHIDHAKLVEILVEASGIEKEKVESQLSEFVEEITEALSEGDAYELEGFGVFSGIGNNVIFIPSDELATEINYKYVGMEPIEMDDSSPEAEKAAAPEEDPVQDQEPEIEDEDPFAGLLDDADEDERPQEPVPSFELDVEEDEGEQVEEEKEPADIEDFADADADEAPFDLADEEPEDDTEEIIVKPGPEKWGIDTYKDDGAENMFSGLLGEQGEQEEPEDNEEDLKPLFNDADDLSSEIGKQLSEEEAEEEASLNETFNDDDSETDASEALSESSPPEEVEDFDDDPFKALAQEPEDEVEQEDSTDKASSKKKKEAKEEDIIPVIKNLASEGSKKKKKEKEAEEEDSRPVFPNKKAAKKSKSQPVMLWVILIILLLGGGTYGLGYYGFINIPGVTPQPQTQVATSNTPATPPATEPQPEQQTTQPEATPQQQQPAQPQATTPDPEPETVEPEEQEAQSQVSQNEVPPNQPTYGLNGEPMSEANDGYTIVIYSLTRESNAEAIENELSNDGYRVLVTQIPSRQYGTLWRVSIGQFESTSDAVLAVENIDPSFTENYFITKIQ